MLPYRRLLSLENKSKVRILEITINCSRKKLCLCFPFLLGPSSRHIRMWNQWNPSKLHLSINPQWRRPIWKPVTVRHLRGSRWSLTQLTTRWWSAEGYAVCTVSLARNLPRWEQVQSTRRSTDDSAGLWSIGTAFYHHLRFL